MRLNKFRKGAKRRGFTLIEILLVVGILVALAAIALPNFIGASETAKLRNAKIQVTNIESACDIFRAMHDDYPDNGSGIAALSNTINGKPPAMKRAVAPDPWNMPYNYQYPGTRNTSGGPDIWSSGPDKQSGTADDIGNWPGQDGK